MLKQFWFQSIEDENHKLAVCSTLNNKSQFYETKVNLRNFSIMKVSHCTQLDQVPEAAVQTSDVI